MFKNIFKTKIWGPKIRDARTYLCVGMQQISSRYLQFLCSQSVSRIIQAEHYWRSGSPIRFEVKVKRSQLVAQYFQDSVPRKSLIFYNIKNLICYEIFNLIPSDLNR